MSACVCVCVLERGWKSESTGFHTLNGSGVGGSFPQYLEALPPFPQWHVHRRICRRSHACVKRQHGLELSADKMRLQGLGFIPVVFACVCDSARMFCGSKHWHLRAFLTTQKTQQQGRWYLYQCLYFSLPYLPSSVSHSDTAGEVKLAMTIFMTISPQTATDFQQKCSFGSSSCFLLFLVFLCASSPLMHSRRNNSHHYRDCCSYFISVCK